MTALIQLLNTAEKNASLLNFASRVVFVTGANKGFSFEPGLFHIQKLILHKTIANAVKG